MVTRGVDVLWRMGYAFGTYNGIYFEPDEGRYLYGPLTDRYQKFLEYLNRLYTEGLLDPDFAASNKSLWMEALTSGKSYFFFENGSFATDINLVTTAANPEAKFVPMTTLENYFGTRRAMFFEGSGVISPFRNDVWVISSRLSGEKLQAALSLMDYLYSEEGRPPMFLRHRGRKLHHLRRRQHPLTRKKSTGIWPMPTTLTESSATKLVSAV